MLGLHHLLIIEKVLDKICNLIVLAKKSKEGVNQKEDLAFIILISVIIVEPHKTPDSRLEM